MKIDKQLPFQLKSNAWFNLTSMNHSTMKMTSLRNCQVQRTKRSGTERTETKRDEARRNETKNGRTGRRKTKSNGRAKRHETNGKRPTNMNRQLKSNGPQPRRVTNPVWDFYKLSWSGRPTLLELHSGVWQGTLGRHEGRHVSSINALIVQIIPTLHPMQLWSASCRVLHSAPYSVSSGTSYDYRYPFKPFEQSNACAYAQLSEELRIHHWFNQCLRKSRRSDVPKQRHKHFHSTCEVGRKIHLMRFDCHPAQDPRMPRQCIRIGKTINYEKQLQYWMVWRKPNWADLRLSKHFPSGTQIVERTESLTIFRGDQKAGPWPTGRRPGNPKRVAGLTWRRGGDQKATRTIPGPTWRHKAAPNAVPGLTWRRQAGQNAVTRPS